MARIARAALALSAGLAALAAGTTTAHARGAAAPARADLAGVVQIQAGSSNQCVAVTTGPKTRNGERAHLDYCDTDSEGTLWRVNPTANSAVEFRSWNGDKCLEVENSGSKEGAAVQVWDCNGGKQMRWQVDLVIPNRNLYQIRPTHAQNRCLDVPNSNISQSMPLWQWACNQSKAQLWQIKPLVGFAS
ncbi:RICIN domain-containing protein [Streptomyces luteireticuli]|uniref:RICIN domain-containing protein n=1 Tax=Streptomyces luteireticuli TaxID=173858 RepID=UPI00355629BD